MWKALRGLPGAVSVWDAHFGPSGAPKTARIPATTNKMRGPLSRQTKKIGEHMAHVIDHPHCMLMASLIAC